MVDGDQLEDTRRPRSRVMGQAADERQLVVAVMLGPDDDARIALGGYTRSVTSGYSYDDRVAAVLSELQ